MPINARLISGERTSFSKHASLLHIGDQITLSRDVTTTNPDRRTYAQGTTGWIRKFYGNGAILQMAGGRKIPVSFDFLDVPQPIAKSGVPNMPRPYETI